MSQNLMAGVQPATAEVLEWARTQVNLGVPWSGVLSSMERSGWSGPSALGVLLKVLEVRTESDPPVPRVVATLGDLSVSVNVAPDPDLERSGLPARLKLPDRDVEVLVEMRHPRVVVFGSFLSDQECDALVALAEGRLSRSETVDSDTGGSAIHGARTSDGMFFQRQETELIQRIEQRIEHLLNWPVERGEGIQVLRYRAGAEYRPHYDYFDESQPGVSRILSRGGQRVGTLVMYLNAPEQGGSTTFPDVGLSVLPVKGQAVFFAYPVAHPDSLTLHGGAEVRQGVKWVATKWLRQSRFD